MIRWASLCAALWWLASPASALECRNETYDSNRYTLCEVDTAQEPLTLFLRDKTGAPFGHFRALEAERGPLAFATNAGMYHDDRRPVGHYVENGQQEMRIVANPGPGNFGLLPNGILCLRDGRADVIETLRFVAEKPACTHATQSGPMLVIDGALHPRFIEGSDSRHLRNGVGTSADGTRAVFVISNNAVNFHDFGSFFKDHLKLPQALFFDGNISRFKARALNRSDNGFRMGPIIGLLEADVKPR